MSDFEARAAVVICIIGVLLGFACGLLAGKGIGSNSGRCAVRMEYAVTAADSLRLVRDSACVLEKKP